MIFHYKIYWMRGVGKCTCMMMIIVDADAPFWLWRVRHLKSHTLMACSASLLPIFVQTEALVTWKTSQMSQTLQSRVGKRHTTTNVAIWDGRMSHHPLMSQLSRRRKPCAPQGVATWFVPISKAEMLYPHINIILLAKPEVIALKIFVLTRSQKHNNHGLLNPMTLPTRVIFFVQKWTIP